jgi:HlyD family secretion protein/macrolide-specific efflux system membrane fusion protein
VRLDAFPSRELTGALKSIGSVGASEKNESRTFPVTVAVDQADPRFRPGMITRCSVLCGKLENVVALPVEAVRSDERGLYVLVVSALGPPSRRAVKLGPSSSRYVEVREGLKAGEVVRVTGD